jgi:hypothetical protein
MLHSSNSSKIVLDQFEGTLKYKRNKNRCLRARTICGVHINHHFNCEAIEIETRDFRVLI